MALDEPVERLCGALAQVRSRTRKFLFPLLNRVVDPDVSRNPAPPPVFEAVCEKGRDCKGARGVQRSHHGRCIQVRGEFPFVIILSLLTGRAQISVQIRTYHVVCAAAYESKRYAQEIHTLLALDQEMMQRHSAMMRMGGVLSDVGQHEIKTEAHRSCGRPDHREWPMLLTCLRKLTSSLQASRNGSRQRFSKATIDQQ